MSEPLHMETLMRKHTSRWRRHAALFTQVMPEAVRAQDALMHALAQDLEARRHIVKPDGDFSAFSGWDSEKSPPDYLVEAFTQRLKSRKSSANKPLVRWILMLRWHSPFSPCATLSWKTYSCLGQIKG